MFNFNKDQREEIQSIAVNAMQVILQDATSDEPVYAEGKHLRDCVLEIIRKDLARD